jgi:2-oxoglutarate dehydrogenase E2 component (dihydrolipoamide succinyltransferase)
MAIEIKIPSVGESVQEAVLAEWFKKDGDLVQKDEPLFVIETDKVTLEVVAEASGILKILIPDGETVAIDTVVGQIDTAGAVEPPAPEAKPEQPPATAAAVEAPAPSPPPEVPPAPIPAPAETPPATADTVTILPPSVRRLVAEKHVDISPVTGSGPGGRITKGDVLLYLEQQPAGGAPETLSASTEALTVPAVSSSSLTHRKPMSPIRQRIAERLLEAKQSTAMLTTFNEIDMGRMMAIRKSYKESFREKYDVNLGMMSFFTKACVQALQEIPEINAYIEGQDILYHDYCHIGIAVGTDKGLVVPVIRHAEKLSFAEIEQAIVDYVKRIRENRLSLSDLEGGTFTISNGGVYGSLLSTPILNTPQSGILGMHKLEDRPVVINGEIVIRTMMYVALSYDHRIVDGKGAVTFLKRVKEFIENPERMILEI